MTTLFEKNESNWYNYTLIFSISQVFNGKCFTQVQLIKDCTIIDLLKISISTTLFTCKFKSKGIIKGCNMVKAKRKI